MNPYWTIDELMGMDACKLASVDDHLRGNPNYSESYRRAVASMLLDVEDRNHE
jgi:hypothetical protein